MAVVLRSIVLVATFQFLIASSAVAPFYKPLNEEAANALSTWTPESKQNIWELSGQYQGDIVMTPGQKNGIIGSRYRWPNREIVYQLDGIFSAAQRDVILRALADFQAKTCITARPKRSTDRDFVYVTGENTGCWSYVGKQGGMQKLNLQVNGCVWHSTVIHEFLHALGFFHQQSATNRDSYVDIYWQNIQNGYAYAFDKYSANQIDGYGEPYDYYSVMHYGTHAFSNNGQPTMLPKDRNAPIGKAPTLSRIDIRKLNKMYGCRV